MIYEFKMNGFPDKRRRLSKDTRHTISQLKLLIDTEKYSTLLLKQ